MKDAMSLEALLERYSPVESDLGDAIINAEVEQFELMKAFPEGVPSGVMFTASLTGMEWLAQLVASMLTELRAIVEEWDREEWDEQDVLARGVFQLLRVHATNTVLATYKPEVEDVE